MCFLEYMCFDIGGTSIKFGVLNELGSIYEKSSFPTPETKAEIIANMVTTTKCLQGKYPGIAGIGVSCPGTVAEDGTLKVAGAILSLYGVPLKQELEDKTHLPVFIENDANCAALAEKWNGNAQDSKNYVCLVLGTGIGGGIVINDQLYKGGHGLSGEFGFSIIDGVSEKGNIEDDTMNYKGAVVLGLYNQYNLALQKAHLPVDDLIDAKKIIQLKNEKNTIATRVLNQYSIDLSTLLLNIISFFDPEKIIIGGGISANEQFMHELIETFEEMFSRHESLANIGRENMAQILPAKLKNDAGLTGAGYLIHQTLKQKGKCSK